MLKSSEDYSIVCKNVDNQGKYEYIKKELDKYADIRNVPGECRISMGLYNKIFYYSHIVNYSYTFSNVGEIDNSMEQISEKKESLYEKIARYYGYNKEDIDDYSFHKFLKEEDDLSIEKRFNSKIQEDICRIVEKNYMERYEDMKDKRGLVSEKFIKKLLIEKYIK